MRSLSKSSQYEPYFQKYGNSEEKLFNSMKDVYMLALVLGCLKKNRIPFTEKGGDPIKLSIFNSEDLKIMDLMTLAATEDLNILTKEQEEEKFKLIEEYTNGGMEILVKELGIIPNMRELKNMVINTINPNDGKKVIDYEDILNSAFEDV